MTAMFLAVTTGLCGTGIVFRIIRLMPSLAAA